MNNPSENTVHNFEGGDFIIQTGTFKIGVDKSNKSKSSINQHGLGNSVVDKSTGDINENHINNFQDLAEFAADIKDLLDRLSMAYPTDTPRVLGAKAVDEVEKSPDLKSRFIQGIRAGGIAALEKMIDHPVSIFFIEGAKEAFKS